MQKLIVNAVGADRLGIVEQFTGYLHAGGANILDSRMVNLMGQFAIILLFEAEDAAAESLRRSLPAQGEQIGLRLTVVETMTSAQPLPGIPFRLKTYSMDQPGIIHRVCEVLREFGVNIEDLVSRRESAPFAGTPLFLMEMRLTIPPAVSMKELRSRLQSLCDSLNCDVDLDPA